MTNESAIVSAPYPWQQAQWREIITRIEQQRLPHALLLTGAEGVGKFHFAQCIAQYLLCHTPHGEMACGQCKSCQLIRAQSHPDAWMVKPVKLSAGDKLRKEHIRPEYYSEGVPSGAQIRVEQIRLLAADIAQAPHQGQNKVIIMGPAERMNANAANALLKNLEEPTGNTFFLLYSDMPSQVLATIRSRCQQLVMTTPAYAKTQQWLESVGCTANVASALYLSGGAPLYAKHLLGEILQEQLLEFFTTLNCSFQQTDQVDLSIITKWKSMDTISLLSWWSSLLQILIKTHRDHMVDNMAVMLNQTSLSHADPLDQLLVQSLNNGVHLNKQWLFKLLDKMLQQRSQLVHGANPNAQLLLEDLLLDWYAIINKSVNA